MDVLAVKNLCKKSYNYWNETQGDDILLRYVRALRSAQWSDEQILNNLQAEVKRICNSSRSWTQWSDTMEQWIIDIGNWGSEDNSSIKELGTILPTQLFEDVSLISSRFVNRLMRVVKIIFLIVRLSRCNVYWKDCWF